MRNEKLIQLLNKSISYASKVGGDAEALHDNPDGDYYMDSVQYEIMTKANEFMSELQREIDKLEAT